MVPKCTYGGGTGSPLDERSVKIYDVLLFILVRQGLPKRNSSDQFGELQYFMMIERFQIGIIDNDGLLYLLKIWPLFFLSFFCCWLYFDHYRSQKNL